MIRNLEHHTGTPDGDDRYRDYASFADAHYEDISDSFLAFTSNTEPNLVFVGIQERTEDRMSEVTMYVDAERALFLSRYFAAIAADLIERG